MALLPIVHAPHPIFREKAAPVGTVNAGVRQLVADMFETLYAERALGLSAPMLGIAKQIAVIDLEGGKAPLCLIDPRITWRSDDLQTHEEASLSFPYISAEVTRPHAITVAYTDEQGAAQERTFEGFAATVVQHELDYFEGRTFLDHLSRMKRDMLRKKMQKLMRQDPPHVHGPHCNH
jgi:peptide deformylase